MNWDDKDDGCWIYLQKVGFLRWPSRIPPEKITYETLLTHKNALQKRLSKEKVIKRYKLHEPSNTWYMIK